jgi:hypothetical protein
MLNKLLIAALLLLAPSEAPNVSARAEYVFTILNNSSYALGTVSINGSGASVNVDVPSPGSYTTNISFSASSVTVASQEVGYPNSGIVTLVSGSKVQVQWQSINSIEIINYGGQN